MDLTLDNLALLANYLGYGWAGGCRGRRAGQDFLREGDSWKAHYQKGCGGYMSTSRLKIVYENFSFMPGRLLSERFVSRKRQPSRQY